MTASITPIIREHGRCCRAKIRIPRRGDRIGFLFTTKDRSEFTEATLRSIDQEEGFDLIWADGSQTDEGRSLPDRFPVRRARLVEVHRDVRGGPDAAIAFGLSRLMEFGYDYCGLLENDVVLHRAWFSSLLRAIDAASREGLAVGAASVRNYMSRVLEFRESYTINWAHGAGMVLFTREAAELLLDRYRHSGLGSWTTARQVAGFYRDLCGVDLRGIYDLWAGRPDRRLCPDWAYTLILYAHGLASVGTIPSLATDLEGAGTPASLRTAYVGEDSRGRGLHVSLIQDRSRAWLDVADALYDATWVVLRRSPQLVEVARGLSDWFGFDRGLPRQVKGAPGARKPRR